MIAVMRWRGLWLIGLTCLAVACASAVAAAQPTAQPARPGAVLHGSVTRQLFYRRFGLFRRPQSARDVRAYRNHPGWFSSGFSYIPASVRVVPSPCGWAFTISLTRGQTKLLWFDSTVTPGQAFGEPAVPAAVKSIYWAGYDRDERGRQVTQIVALVPDGVAKVRFFYPGAESRTVAVSDNAASVQFGRRCCQRGLRLTSYGPTGVVIARSDPNDSLVNPIVATRPATSRPSKWFPAAAGA